MVPMLLKGVGTRLKKILIFPSVPILNSKIPTVWGFLPIPVSKYIQKEAPYIFTSDFKNNLVVFGLYNLAQVAYLV